VLARPDSLAYRRASSCAATAALPGHRVAGTVWQARQAQQQRLLAEQHAERQARLAHLTSAMGRLVAVALGPVSDKPVLVADVLARGQTIAEHQFANQPRVKAHLLRALGVMWAEGGDLDITAYNPALNNFANVLLRAGQVQRADAVLQDLLARQQGPGAGREREPAEAVNHALAMTQLGRGAEAVPLIDAVLARPAVQASPYVMLRAAITAAEAHCDAGDLARCAVHADQVQRMLAAKPDGNQETRLRMLLVQGQLALRQGRLADARGLAEAAIAESQSPLVNASRQVAAAMLAAEVTLAQGHLVPARQQADQAVADARQKFAGFQQSRPLGLALRLQGQVALAAGDAPAARAAWQEAVKQLDAALGPDAADARDARQRLAGLARLPN
jgi:tetratricopeptide (TPR) repeat protein